ncbi:hypothetical protein CANARDRAFT_177878 [[Candida] arabinofermentans NRRL YB-2248]|uniref:Uncharacterized protein n=1 Tax=[Candida] arabinofermentans NRRL YB-2248 TaxID=983967 RepID=A0A1E4SUN8_9ASCO|nr:hypothetical protein CANARDRAFT_177878 [[Candida] arabinofermentans NRRL YB-2248]
MTSATASLTRIALGPVSDSCINISNHNHNKSKSFGGFKKLPQVFNTSPSPSLKRSATYDGSQNDSLKKIQLESSPRLERARMLKLKLQLAYYKVKTDQTDVLLDELKVTTDKEQNQEQQQQQQQQQHPINRSFDTYQPQISSPLTNKKQASNAIADLLAASTPLILNKQKKRKLWINNNNKRVRSNSTGKIVSIERYRVSKNPSVGFLDDVVRKKGTRENLKRASLEFLKSVPDLQCPLSAPASQTCFSLNLPSSQTSPSRFVSSVADKSKMKLPPIPKFAQDTKHNDQLPTPSNTNIDTSLENTIIESTTTTQHQIIPMTTPIRKLVSRSNKSSKSSSSSQSNNNTSIDQSNVIDADETQLMQSPTRLMSTPSSIGAARCLLQLAHR